MSNALDESQDEFLETVLDQDSETCADAMECFIDLKQLKEKIIESKESENSIERVTVKPDPENLLSCKTSYLVKCGNSKVKRQAMIRK